MASLGFILLMKGDRTIYQTLDIYHGIQTAYSFNVKSRISGTGDDNKPEFATFFSRWERVCSTKSIFKNNSP